MEITTHHQIFYSNRDLIPLKEVASSLLSLESIIKHSPSVLEQLFPGVMIKDTQVYIEKLTAGSLYEDIIVKFIFGSQARLDQFISDARETLYMTKLSTNKQILTAIVASLILSGGSFCAGKYLLAKPEEVAKIEINNSNIIVYGAGLAGVSSDEFKKMISKSLKGKESKIGKDAIKIVRPAKRDPEAQIIFDGNPVISVSPESIKAMPDFVPEEDDEEIEEFSNVQLQIRAIDLDSLKRGWAAIIPSLGNSRVRLQLAPTVKPEQLTAGGRVYGNISVLYRHSDGGQRVPRLVFLKEIVDQKNLENEENIQNKKLGNAVQQVTIFDK
ncbi:MAG: hypothetical protein ACLQVJ_11590 [Syntrophobacteraceae bacterium]